MLVVFKRESVRGGPRRGLTLVEMLVAVTVTLILLFALLRLAQLIGSSSETGRSMLELSGEIRSAANRMQIDLDRTTCKTLAWVNSSAAQGYFEYIEGPLRDGGGVGDSLTGDPDDRMAFTIHSPNEPFSGRIPLPGDPNGSQIGYSEYAEVVWWTSLQPDGTYAIRRRLFLVRPDVTIQVAPGDSPSVAFRRSLLKFDVSISRRPNGLITNSMADLSRREYRTIHQSPNQIADANSAPSNTSILATNIDGTGGPTQDIDANPSILRLQNTFMSDTYNLQGEDVVLGRGLAMDIKAYDPYAPIGAGPLSALVPGDPGYSIATAKSSGFGRGAYVDLNYAGTNDSWFSGPPMAKSYLGMTAYDFWSAHYENDGVDQGGIAGAGADEGVDGLDNDGNNGVDDANERETSPPYPYPLRGVKVILRAYEPSSRQVRQASVVGDFVPN